MRYLCKITKGPVFVLVLSLNKIEGGKSCTCTEREKRSGVRVKAKKVGERKVKPLAQAQLIYLECYNGSSLYTVGETLNMTPL